MAIPAEFALYAMEKMQPLHRQLIVDNVEPDTVDGQALLEDLKREFVDADNMEAFMQAASSRRLQAFCFPGALSQGACKALRNVVDSEPLSHSPDSVDSLPEHQRQLPATEAREQLEELIGARETQRLLSLPLEFYRAEQRQRRAEKETGTSCEDETGGDDGDESLYPPIFSLQEAFIRRYSSDSRPFNPFHMDRSHLTVNVALTSSDDHVGGQLLAVQNGRVQVLERAEGEATLHGSDLLHGVSAMSEGVRYSFLLFFSKRQRPAPSNR